MCDVKKLIRKRDGSEDPVYFASIEHSFDIIQKAHIATGHGGRDKMMKELSKKYANITQEAVTIFKSSCVPCQQKKKRTTTKGVVVKPITSTDFGARA
ncbi:hypothetical protein SNE40_005916 [Patella caerulea]|uniref:Integrase zinc-binding domain-containing protein n=1 Tax=Patella caerulea TaxID=87958 RepID=A0AAN8PVF3_PATCE